MAMDRVTGMMLYSKQNTDFVYKIETVGYCLAIVKYIRRNGLRKEQQSFWGPNFTN